MLPGPRSTHGVVRPPPEAALRGVEAVSIELVASLNFGRVAPGQGSDAAVTIDSRSGTKTVAGGAVDLGGLHRRGEYIVRGEPGTRIMITLLERSRLQGRHGEIELVNLETYPEGVTTIGPDGQVRIYVGGVLHVTNGVAPGEYEGRTDLFVDTL